MKLAQLTTTLLALFLLTACPPAPDTMTNGTSVPGKPVVKAGEEGNLTTYDKRRPRNIILMIGDGMGVTQISAGLYSNGNQLNLERFPVLGLHKSYSGDNLITDSAAGATAFSAGTKTYNGAIGVDLDTLPVETILELAERRGLPTGMVSTSSIVHATPASFIAHNRYRKNYEEIAADFVKTDIDLFIGGGQNYFERREIDGRNLSTELRSRGYVVESFLNKEVAELTIDNTKPFVYYTANAEPLPFAQGRDYLVPAVQRAITYLDQRDKEDKGFFLMVEGSQIDWGGHSNDSDYIISEMIDFDNAVGEALNFAARDGETLVIVTADHETGGYAIQNGSRMGEIEGAFTSDYHTADLIPVFAYGPGAARFSGIYENTAIFDKMKLLFGF